MISLACSLQTLTAIIFDLVDDKVWYDLLLPRPTTSIQFSHFLVKCDRCDKLIAAMLKLKRRNKAADLLKLYFKRWPERLAAECTSDDDWIAAYEQRQY